MSAPKEPGDRPTPPTQGRGFSARPPETPHRFGQESPAATTTHVNRKVTNAMYDYYCPQHKGITDSIIDTWPTRCGTCCKMGGGHGTPQGGCCPELWREVSPEDFAALHVRQPFADDEYVLVQKSRSGPQYFVNQRTWKARGAP